MPIYIYFTAAVVVGAIVALVALLSGERPVDTVQENLSRGGRVGDSRQIALSAPVRDRLLDPFFDQLAGLGRRAVGKGSTDRTMRKLELAGLRDAGWTVERVLVIKVLAVGLGVVLILAILSNGIDSNALLLSLLVGAIAYLGPNAWLDRKAGERQALILRHLPDVIDQLTVSVEAGLGFDAAMARSAEGRSGPLADELTRVIQDLQVGVPRQEALERMADRTDVADLRQFVVAVRQSTKHGLPIARILRVQSQELREKRKARIEEKAASLPVKIVFPLVFCILPSLFVVILGPAALNIRDSF